MAVLCYGNKKLSYIYVGKKKHKVTVRDTNGKKVIVLVPVKEKEVKS